MLHDTGGTFGTQHAFIDGVIAIAFNIADLPGPVGSGFHVNINATTAGAHITSGLVNLIAYGGRKVDWMLHCSHFELSKRDQQLMGVAPIASMQSLIPVCDHLGWLQADNQGAQRLVPLFGPVWNQFFACQNCIF